MRALLTLGATVALIGTGLPAASAQQGNDVVVPNGYQVREFATGLGAAIAASVAPNGDVYVLSSGFPGFAAGAQPGPVEIWKISPAGQSTRIYNAATQPGLVSVALGIAAKDDDTIFVNDGEGIKRVRRDGSVQMLAKLPTEGDHINDHIVFGPDGKLYWGEGSATNSGVVGPDNQEVTGWLSRHPDFHDIPCADVTLTGANFTSKNSLSGDASATVTTGPYLPFGTAATAGQVIKGATPCTSAILRMNQDGTGLEAVAWGFRNPFGLAFSPPDSVLKGALVVSNNGADVRGSRPIENDGDDLFVIQQGGWYGWPDYLDEQPVTEPRFKPADAPAPPMTLAAPVEGQALSAITHFPKGVSADGMAFSTSDDFGWRNDVFIALWGPLGFGAQPASPAGFNVYRVHFGQGPNGVLSGAEKEIFVRNKIAGSASQSKLNGLEHPSDVKFSPDGKTMYVLDFGLPPAIGGRMWAVTRTPGVANPAGGVGTAPAPAATPAPAAAPTPTPAPAAAAPAPAPVPAPAAPAAASAAVNVQGFAFQPMDLTVAAGTTVTWTNNDSVAHTVTWDDMSVDSGLFGQGETFTHTFDAPGTFGYYCIPHGSPGTGMHGSVTVT
ncbi:MAG TPA: plastocyanin/azurin family copper-binding protein [Chloroflexota bacterium]